MVPDSSSQTLDRPLSLVQRLFDQHVNQGNSQDSTHSSDDEEVSPSDWGIRRHMDELIKDEVLRRRIPSLNSTAPTSLPRGSLVRARIMIQDTNYRRELSIDQARPSENEPWSCYRYMDGVEELPETLDDVDPCSPLVRLVEHQSIYGVSPPAETEWARMMYDGEDASAAIEQGMRSLSLQEPSLEALSHKDPLKEGRTAVIIKVVGSDEPFRVAELVEVYGILGSSPLNEDETDLLTSQSAPSNPVSSPPSPSPEIPCIHALTWSSLDRGHPMARVITEDPSQSTDTEYMESQRSSLLDHFTQLFRGDDLAAQFLLLHLSSRLYHRLDSMATVGPLSLNLTGPIQGLTQILSKELASLVPRFHSMPLSLEKLEEGPWWPRDDGSGLWAGPLQLAPGTHLLVDEGALDEGQIKDTGLRNLRALTLLAREQRLQYGFAYSPEMSMDVEVPLLVLSPGRSLLPNLSHLPLRMSDSGSESPHASVGSMQRRDWIIYLARVHSMPYTVPLDVSERIQEGFVQARKDYTDLQTQGHHSESTIPLPVITEDDLSRRLLLARILTSTRGETALSWERWLEAQSLDEHRLRRTLMGVRNDE